MINFNTEFAIVRKCLSGLRSIEPKWRRYIYYTDLLRYFSEWSHSLKSGASPLQMRIPWFTYGGIRFLRNIINKEMTVFEYGCGGSTLFFSEYAKHVVSVEHDIIWANMVNNSLKVSGISNVDLQVKIPESHSNQISTDIASFISYASSDIRYSGQSFYEYACAIDAYPDSSFDIIVIDGRARPSCFKHASSKLKPNGYLIIDNGEISHYWQIHDALETEEWEKRFFYGLVPFAQFTMTCFWHHR